jgi:hypothetical protein
VFGTNRASTVPDRIKAHRKTRINQKNGVNDVILMMFEISRFETGPDFR